MKTRRNGFTMIELMIVIVIVPMLRGRLQRAKWSEGMAGCSAIATSIRSWAAENAHEGGSGTAAFPSTVSALGFQTGDLDGKYFEGPDGGTGLGDYTITGGALSYGDDGAMTFTYTITCAGDSDATTAKPQGSLTLNQGGTFTLTQDGTVSTF